MGWYFLLGGLSINNGTAYKYNSAGTYQNVFRGMPLRTTGCMDIEWDGTHFYVIDGLRAEYTSTTQQVLPYQITIVPWQDVKYGIAWDGTYFLGAKAI